MQMKTNSAIRNRKKTAVLVGFGTIASIVVSLLLLERALQVGGPEPPWPLPELAAEDATGTTWRSSAALPKPAALIYATHTCPHCKEELARWNKMIDEGVRANVWVIAAAQSKMDGMPWVPSALRDQTVADIDGNIARSLSVRYVPATFWIDRADTVRIVRIGQSTRSQILKAMSEVGMTK